MSALLDSAIRKLYAYVDQRIDSVRAFPAVVIGQSDGMVQIKRLTDPGSGETQLNARVRGFDLQTDDRVLVIQVPDWPISGARSAYVVVDVLQRATPTQYELTPNLILHGDLTVDGSMGDIVAGDVSVAGIFDDASGSYTPTVGAAMGSSPGSITQVGNEYCGRITQNAGASGTTTGILWTIAFANARPSGNYNIFLNPQNSDSAAVRAYAINDSASQFTIRCQTAPGAGQQMRFGWWLVQR